MVKKYVRFPNESYFVEILINMDDFVVIKEFDDEIFGTYDGLYISISK